MPNSCPITKIDTFKSHCIEDLNKCYGLHKEVIDHHVYACKSALKTLSLENTNHEKMKESGNNDLQILSEEIKAEKYEHLALREMETYLVFSMQNHWEASSTI